uniref:Uncharacterized protein MANES_03G044800 n=1 Tax=Rhizophora mucronata TaxID=61149 RepID=A0A2P2QZA5_RHIMU
MMEESLALRTEAATSCPAPSRFICRSSGYTRHDRTFT